MKRILLITVGLLAVLAFQPVEAGEDCSAYKKGEASLKSIKLGEFATKEDKLKAYRERYGDISYNDLKSAIKKGEVVIIDANGKESFNKTHVTGAISFHDKKKLAKALPRDKDALIVAYCGSPKCAAWTAAADYVAAKGYTNVTHYSEGIKGWVKRTSE